MSTRRVAVIGAGAAGLVAARELDRLGHRVTVFERGAQIGGVWVYTPQPESDPLGASGERVHSSLYASLRTNLPRDLMAFLDYPFDSSGGGADEWPRFPGHAEVRAYLENFADEFHLRRLIRFDTRVLSVRAAQGWAVEYISEGRRRTESFDAVAVCNGHFAEPRLPVLPGLEVFPGALSHSHNYRQPEPFAGKTVALLGASASARDLSREIASAAARVYWCADAFADPSHQPLTANLECRPGIARLRADGGLELTDGQRVGPVDALVFCTGYRYDYPFLDSALLTVQDNWVQPLWQDLLHVVHPTLAFIGIPFRVVPFPLFEIQARWFAGVVSGEVTLPDATARREDTARRVAALRAQGVKQRHFHQRSLDCYDYLDGLADQCGGPRIPAWHRQLTAALLEHVAAHPGSYRDRPLPTFGPTRARATALSAAPTSRPTSCRCPPSG